MMPVFSYLQSFALLALFHHHVKGLQARQPVPNEHYALAERQTSTPTSSLVEPNSTFFSTVNIAYSATLNNYASDGDLWPTTWADDGHLYTANGDGLGFSPNSSLFADITVSRISGKPDVGIYGTRLAAGEALGPIWTPGTYNRKPTGIVAVDGDGDGHDELYLVVQDLNDGPNNTAFNSVPTASIVKSTDYGQTWTWTKAPMFTNYTFTTVFFLDYGQSNSQARVLGSRGARYVYAYGLDHNWRDSEDGIVPSPVSLYLARAPVSSIQDIKTWEYFSGTSRAPAWSSNIANRKPVLHDAQRVYPGGDAGPEGFSVLSQGSVVYNAPLQRYLYTSWTDYTFEFYESSQPWGPFSLFGWRDFGAEPWFGITSSTPKQGGYATTIPSKFISDDGMTMWVQSNWFLNAASGSAVNYCFSLRPLTVTKYEPSQPRNSPGDKNLAMEAGTVTVDKTSHYGHDYYLNDGETISEDSYDASIKTLDRWGYTWPKEYHMNRVVYTTGDLFFNGGWFMSNLTVQIRQNFVWKDVTSLVVHPPYPYNSSACPTRRYEFKFDKVAGDGIQIIGVPGGSATFTSIGELEVYYTK